MAKSNRYVSPVVDPITHVSATGHDTTDRSVLAAIEIGLDHAPAGPAVVVVVAWVVVVVGALDVVGLLLHAAASNDSATTASAAVNGPARLGTRCGPEVRSTRGPGGATTYRAR